MRKLRYEERMPCNYETQKDLSERLGGTICRYDGRPVQVEYHSPIKLILYNLLKTEVVAQIKPSDPKFDISALELGYLNFRVKSTNKGNVLYTSVGPRKQYQQGLRFNNIIVGDIKGDKGDYSPAYLNNKGFEDSLMGVFPSLDDALNDTTRVFEKALSQELAIRKEDSGIVLVYFRCRNLGFMLPDSDEVTLAKGEFFDVVRRIIEPYDMKVRS